MRKIRFEIFQQKGKRSMGQLCGCARSQDRRGGKWINNTILTRTPSTTSSNYGPNNIIIKHHSQGGAVAVQRSMYSQGGATHAPSTQRENRSSRNHHQNSPEDSGIRDKTPGSCFGPISSGPEGREKGHVTDFSNDRIRTEGQGRSRESSVPVTSPNSNRCDVTKDVEAKITSEPEVVHPATESNNDVTVRVNDDHLLESQAQKVRSILQKTVELLEAEIDTCTLVEYLQRSRPDRQVTIEDWNRCCSPSGAQDIFWDVITQQPDDDYSVFCGILDSRPHFRHLLDLLQTLDSIVALVTPDLDDTGGCHDDDYDDDDEERACGDCVDSGGDFDLDLTSCHRAVTLTSISSSSSAIPVHFDCSNVSLHGVGGAGVGVGVGVGVGGKVGGGGNSSCQPSISSDDQDQPTVPMVSLSLTNHCLRRRGGRQRAGLLHRILEDSSCVRELSLVKTHLDESDLAILFRLVGSNVSLVRLDLRLSRLSNTAAAQLGAALGRNAALRCLNVAGTGLSDIACTRLMSGLAGNRVMTDLDVGFNDIRDTGCCSVAEVLSRSTGLRRVRIRDNEITCYGACALFQSLARNCRLVYLDVSSNAIGADAACLRFLSEALISNRTLRELNLENCRISAGGCAALARALRANTALRCLQLSLNPVADAGVEVLADGLRYNRSLETLSLNMCNVGNVGFLHVLDALRSNYDLRTVKFCYNDIGFNRRCVVTSCEASYVDEIYVRLHEVLHYNPKLKVLLWGNNLERNQAETESLLSVDDDKLDHRNSRLAKLNSYSPIMDIYRHEVIASA